MKQLIKLSALLASVFLLSGFSFFKTDCSSFKTGEYVVKAGASTTYIERFADYQTEYTPAAGLKLKSKITWESDCSYFISDYEVLKNTKKMDVSDIEKGQKIYFEIVKIKKNSIKTVAHIDSKQAKGIKITYHRR